MLTKCKRKKFFYSKMTANLVYLANFLNPPKNYFNFYREKILILAQAFHLAYITSLSPTENHTLA